MRPSAEARGRELHARLQAARRAGEEQLRREWLQQRWERWRVAFEAAEAREQRALEQRDDELREADQALSRCGRCGEWLLAGMEVGRRGYRQHYLGRPVTSHQCLKCSRCRHRHAGDRCTSGRLQAVA